MSSVFLLYYSWRGEFAIRVYLIKFSGEDFFSNNFCRNSILIPPGWGAGAAGGRLVPCPLPDMGSVLPGKH